MNSDFKDLLRVFNEEKDEYLIVGAYAVVHCMPTTARFKFTI